MRSGNNREALVICGDTIVFSLAGKHCVYLLRYFNIKLTSLFSAYFPNQDDTDLICKPCLCCLFARGGRLVPLAREVSLIPLITKTISRSLQFSLS